MPPRPDIDAVLRERFGFRGFRPGQRELIEAALAGRDALGILPTGGGKSLTSQLPATLLDGLTVIVSPLIALMNDQVDAFNRRRLGRAVAIHSNLSPRDARAALDQARSGAARLLYLKGVRPGDALLAPDIATMDIPAVILEASPASPIPAVSSAELWVMADLDGWTVLAALNGDPELADIPIILVTTVDFPSAIRSRRCRPTCPALREEAAERLGSAHLGVDRLRVSGR